MKFPKSRDTVFTRIILASLIPVFLIFTMMIGTVSGIIFSENASFAREKTFGSIDHALKLTNNKFANMSSRLGLASQNMLAIDISSPDAKQNAENMLLSLLKSDDDIYCAWFVFEPGALDGERYPKKYIMENGNGHILELFDFNDELLDNPDLSPWYNVPLETGEMYIDSTNRYDYGTGEGAIYICSIAYPIIKDSKVIGVMGVDVLYGAMFRSIDSMQQDEDIQTVHLLSDGGDFTYPKNDAFFGKKLVDLNFSNINSFNNAIENRQTLIEENYSPLIDENSLIYFQPFEFEHASRPMFLYIDLPTSSLYRDAYTATGLFVLTGVVGLALLATSIFFTTKNIVRPIKKITNNAIKIAQGHLDVEFEHIKKKSKNEIVILQISLEKMLRELNKSHEFELMALESRYEKEKAEAAIETRDQFFATISHELRTPMNAILGMSELLISGELNDVQHKYAFNIKNSTESLLSIVNDILDISKMEAHSLALNPINYDFGLLLENINSIAKFLCEQKGLTYEYETDGDIPFCLYGDDVRLRQVLINIISNAVKYTPDGTVHFRLIYENYRLRFEISDTGIGIKEEALPIIFEAFTQADIVKNRNIQGTGLGLSISKMLVEMMGGSITAASVYGEGSVFSIVIPAVLGNENEIVKNDESLDGFYAPSLKALIVDDNEINLSVADGLLGLYHISCDMASSGEESIAMVQKTDYDIVFMDHMMPGMDGLQATANIRSLGGKYEKLTIIALTANASSSARDMLLASGMDDFLAKPIEKSKLSMMLLKWIPADKIVRIDVPAEIIGPLIDDKTENLYESPALNRASRIPGLNVQVGLKHVVGREKAYEKVLGILSDKMQDYIKGLQDTLNADDLQNFCIQVHGIKSALAGVGAIELSDMALELEKASRNNNIDYCRTHIDEFFALLSELGSKLNVAMNEPAAV